MAWQFLVTDLNSNVIGEVKSGSTRRVSDIHKQIPSASFTIPVTSPLASTVMSGDCLLRCYRIDPLTGQRTIAFHGPVIGAEESGEMNTQTIAVTAAGPFWRLTKRLIPSSLPKVGWGYGDANNMVDLGSIAHLILNDTNGVHYTGIGVGTHTASVSGWIGRWNNKNVAEAIAELSAGINSFEYVVRPVDPEFPAVVGGWPRIGYMDVAPVIGVSRPDAIFEYGTTKANVQAYSRVKSNDGLLTKAWLSVSGWPDQVEKDSAGNDKYAQVSVADNSAIASRGLFEEFVSDAGLLDPGARTGIGDYHVLLRKQPREVITFKPAVNARPAPLIDYNVGDTVRARAFVSGIVRFDALFRVWGITFDIDENGNESIELTLVIP